ncbi:MAG: alcohol dehydrogenase catalytic domain-containing protein [bacterium]
MKRVEIINPRTAVIGETADPIAGAGEVRVRVYRCGICGSDLHAFKGEHPFISLPAYPGHELAGVIDQVGSGVKGWSIGDRVCVQPQLICGECPLCESGRYNICVNLRVMGCQGSGGLADYILSPATMLHRLPDTVSFDQGALVEPLAVGVRAVRRGGGVAGRTVLIQGAGTIGLACLMVARVYGAAFTVITDTRYDRRKRAEEIGADIAAEPADIEWREWTDKYLKGLGFDIVLECVGIEVTARQAINLVRKGGRIVIAGVFGDDVAIPMKYVQDRELEILGTLMYSKSDFSEALRLIAEDRVPVDRLVSHHLSLGEVPSFFALLDDPKQPSGKMMVHCVSE